MKLNTSALRSWAPPILWASVIFATSCTVISSRQFVHGVATAAGSQVTESGFHEFWKHWWWLFVKGYHVLEFLLFTLLVARSLRKTTHLGSKRSIAIAAIAAVAYAASDEFHQTFVPGRGGLVTDVLIDTIGITVAAIVLLFICQDQLPCPREC